MKIVKILFFACLVTMLVGCVSTNMKVEGKESAVVDWSNRNLGAEPTPEWLEKIIRGNTKEFRNEFEVDNSYVVKFAVGNGKTKDLALASSRVNYNSMRAEELRTKVVSEAAATLADGYQESFANAATVAKVDLTGHELVTQFWQEIVTYDKENETEEQEFICYSVYKITKEAWLETLKSYMTTVIPALPDSDAQKKMAATITSLYESTTTDVEKTNQEVIAEISAKKNALETGVQTADYPAPSASDAGWMDVLETACSVVF